MVGGIRVHDTGSDLPAMLAVLSSFRNRALADKMVCFGEIGLSGELRPVFNGEERLSEAASQGFTHAVIPAANAHRQFPANLAIEKVSSVTDAVAAVFD